MKTDEYKRLLEARLSPYRLHHSLCVSQSAVELAERYGADSGKAYLAGLLHDVTKEATEQEHMQLFKSCGIHLTELERANRKLWHAMSAPLYMKKELSIDDDEILSAVRCHTTGRAGMSTLEKVIYIADFISADRDYDDVEVVREYARHDIDKTMLYTQRYSINELLKKGRCVHPDSVACYNELVLKGIKCE